MALSAKVLALLVPCYLQWCAVAAPQLPSGLPDFINPPYDKEGKPIVHINPCKMSDWQSYTSLYPEWTACAGPSQTSINALAVMGPAAPAVTGFPDYSAPTETNSDGLPVLTIDPCKMSNWQSFTSEYPEWTACAAASQTSVNAATLTGQAAVSLSIPPSSPLTHTHSFSCSREICLRKPQVEAVPTGAMAGGWDFDDLFKPRPDPIVLVPGDGSIDTPCTVVGEAPSKRNGDKPTCTELVEECRRSGRWDCGWEWLDPANCDPIISHQETGVALLNANAVAVDLPAKNETTKVDCKDYCADWLVKCVKKEDQSLTNYGCVCTYLL
jgi:hypothetical protein